MADGAGRDAAFRRVVATMLGADGGCALPFALAVADQLARADDADATETDATETDATGADATGERLALLLVAAAEGGSAVEAAAGALALDATLLAAAYSNLDLLPGDCAAGDRVAAAVARALELLPIVAR